MKSRQAVKDLVKAVSLANLCFIDTWTELLRQSNNLEVRYSVYIFNKYVAILLNVLLLSASFWAVSMLVRRASNRLLLSAARFGFLLLLVFCINRIIHEPLPHFSLEGVLGGFSNLDLAIMATAALALLISSRRGWRHTPTSAACLVPLALVGRTPVLAVVVIMAAVYWFVRTPRVVSWAAPVVVLALFPFTVMTFFQASSLLTRFNEKRPATAAPQKSSPARRVVWLLFDELDYRLTYPKRPEGLDLPEFDRLSSQSIKASNAYPPADYTLMSMPALITGRLLSRAEPVSPSELMITYADTGETAAWSQQPNLFSRAREAGFDTAIVGWYHPYCRIIGESLTRCSCEWSGRMTVIEAMSDQFLKLSNLLPFASAHDLFEHKQREKRADRQRQLSDYLNVLEHAKIAVVDASIDLTLIHLPVPHAPSIYDRYTGSFKTRGENGYLDSLALADRTLGELRLAMEAAGMWEGTAVLVTSDHWWRFYEYEPKSDAVYATEQDHRVPFLVKLAGQKESVAYDPAFNNVLLHDLILELLNSRLSDPAAVTSWLDRNRSIAESPYRLR